jgi:hypothetical protein
MALWAASYEELNAWLLDRCVAYAKAHKHPELTDCTIWQAFEAERPRLVQITGPFGAAIRANLPGVPTGCPCHAGQQQRAGIPGRQKARSHRTVAHHGAGNTRL